MVTIIKANIETKVKPTSENGVYYVTFNKDVTFKGFYNFIGVK